MEVIHSNLFGFRQKMLRDLNFRKGLQKCQEMTNDKKNKLSANLMNLLMITGQHYHKELTNI